MVAPADLVDEVGAIVTELRDLNRRVAFIRLRTDAPASRTSSTDPIPAAQLAEAATRTTIRSHVFQVASERDLLELKRIARRHRSAPGDAEDITFLESRGTDSE